MSERVGIDWNLSEQKRLFDVTGMTALLPVMAPICAASAVSIAIVDKIDPIYTEARHGLDGQPFDCHKLRTMTEPDKRITKLGNLLRKAHFDEIPQAVNIYRGEMSLVGPRPLRARDMDVTMDILSPNEQRQWLQARATAKPAPFGPFQLQQHVTGYALNDYERAMCDIEYAQTASLTQDIQILAKSFTEGIGSFLPPKDAADTTEEPARGERTSRLFRAIGEAMGATISDTEQAYWRVSLVAARAIDDLVDNEPETNVDACLALLLAGKPVGSMTEAESEQFAEIYWQREPEARQKALASFMTLPGYLEQKRAARTAQQLAAVCREEALVFAALLHLPVSDHQDSAPRKQFNRWLDCFAIAGYMADTALDMRLDYESGNSGVRSTAIGRAVLLSHGFAEGTSALKGVPALSLHVLVSSAARTLFTK